jgi:hypothetical protein
VKLQGSVIDTSSYPVSPVRLGADLSLPTHPSAIVTLGPNKTLPVVNSEASAGGFSDIPRRGVSIRCQVSASGVSVRCQCQPLKGG